MFGYPGPFGARLNDTELTLPALAAAEPLNACGGAVAPPPVPGAAALVARGNCSFAAKAQALQQAGFGAMLLFNDEEGEWRCCCAAPLREQRKATGSPALAGPARPQLHAPPHRRPRCHRLPCRVRADVREPQ